MFQDILRGFTVISEMIQESCFKNIPLILTGKRNILFLRMSLFIFLHFESHAGDYDFFVPENKQTNVKLFLIEIQGFPNYLFPWPTVIPCGSLVILK